MDTVARALAADLVRQFANGSISFDDLDANWPPEGIDDAVDAIGKRLWAAFSSDNFPLLLRGERRASSEEAALLSKCDTFLRETGPSRWADSDGGVAS